MTRKHLSDKIKYALRGFLACEFKIILAVAVTLFIANLVYSAYKLGFSDGQVFETSREYMSSGDHSLMIRLRAATSFGLFVCVVGLALRSLFGVLASMLAIAWLFLVYGWWHLKSSAFLRSLEVTDYSKLPDIAHAAGLLGATWWDLLVFAVAAALFIWQGIVLIRIIKAPDHAREMTHASVREGTTHNFLSSENIMLFISIIVLMLIHASLTGSYSHHAQLGGKALWWSPLGCAVFLLGSSLLLRLRKAVIYPIVIIMCFTALAFFTQMGYQRVIDYSPFYKAYALQQALLPVYRPLSILLSIFILSVAIRRLVAVLRHPV